MKRVLIAMLLVVSLLSTGIASGSYVQAKTQKYSVYDSAQAKVKGNKLVVKAPLYVGEKKIKKKKVPIQKKVRFLKKIFFLMNPCFRRLPHRTPLCAA